MPKKILYIDTETTGVDKNKNGIIQIAMLMEFDGEIVDEANIRMRPFKGDIVNPEALEVNGITIADLESYQPASKGYEQMMAFLDKHIDKYDKKDKCFPAGYNVRFDIDFICEFIKKADPSSYGLGSYWNWRAVDPHGLIDWMSYLGMIELENHKLETVCSHYGITIDNAHDALSDIKATRDLILMLNNIFIPHMNLKEVKDV